MNSVKSVCHELWQNRERILRLSLYERKARNNDTILGRVWNILTPVLQICVYWFVFSCGLKMTSMKGNIPYAVWMICGMIPWFCISGSMNASPNSIAHSSSIIRNLNIPMSIIPAKDVMSYLVEQLWMLGFLFFVMLVSGIRPTWTWLGVIYFYLAMGVFLMSFSLFASAIGTVVPDFGRFLAPVVRLLFYVSSTVMSLDGLSRNLQMILKINPLTYIIMGYRNSLLYNTAIWQMPWHGLCFWCITLFFAIIGCILHVRTREKFVDLL